MMLTVGGLNREPIRLPYLENLKGVGQPRLLARGTWIRERIDFGCMSCEIDLLEFAHEDSWIEAAIEREV